MDNKPEQPKPADDQKPVDAKPAEAATQPIVESTADAKTVASTPRGAQKKQQQASAEAKIGGKQGRSPPPPTTPPKGRGRKLLLLLLLVALAGGGYVAWLYYGGQLDIQRMFNLGRDTAKPVINASTAKIPVSPPSGQQLPSQRPENQLGQDLSQPPAGVSSPPATSEISAIQALVAEEGKKRDEAVQRLEQQLAETRLQLNSQGERLRQLASSTRTDWLLAEAEYLLRLANQRLLTERQTASALALMTTADGMLRDLDDPALFPVRKALAADITKVRMAGVVDREGIYLRLDALIQAIPNLQSPMREQATSEADALPANLPWYQRLLENGWRALVKMSGIVRVERLDQPLAPVLLPSEQQLLQLNLRLALEQAQLALMREEQSLYDASIARARGWLTDSFIAGAATTTFSQELAGLAEENINRPLPDAMAAVTALGHYINLWHQRYSDSDGDGDAAAPESTEAQPQPAPPTEQGADAGEGL